MTAPQPFPLLAFPKAWTPGTDGAVKGDAVLAVAVATVGNTLGGMTSYAIGRFLPRKSIDEKAQGWIKRFGAPVTFFAWLPIVGDALCVAAGWLRIHWAAALAFMAAGRLARYLVVAYVSSAI